MHAACSDDPYIPQPDKAPAIQVKAGSQMTGDSDMAGPGAQETNAQNAIGRDRVDEARASAVNRLAAAAEAIAAAPHGPHQDA